MTQPGGATPVHEVVEAEGHLIDSHIMEQILAYVRGLSAPLSTKAQAGLALVKGTADASTKP
jgi:hypothetical protein